MKTEFILKSAVAFLLLSTTAASAQEQLYFFNWSNSTSPELLEKFEKETGIKVIVDVFDNNETALAKLKSGTGGYDVLDATSDFLPIYIKEGLLQEINVAGMPGFKDIDDKWQKPAWDPEAKYSLSWYWGTTSFAVDTAVYTGPTDSLSLLFEPPKELVGKIGMFSSPTEVMSLALTYLGKDQCNTNPADLKELQALLEKQKPAVKLYNSDAVVERMSSGETAASEDWNGDAMRARLARPSVKYVYPKEGLIAWAETLSIPKTAPHTENAKKFIQFLMKPENSALETNFVRYASTVKGAEQYYIPELRGAPELTIPDGIRLVFSKPCGEQAIKFYDKIWTKLKN